MTLGVLHAVNLVGEGKKVKKYCVCLVMELGVYLASRTVGEFRRRGSGA